MAKAIELPKLGFKRVCPSCSTRYYDLLKNPPVCPSCGAIFDPEGLVRTRRRAIQAEKDAGHDDELDVAVLDDDGETALGKLAGDDLDDDEEEALIEDASELEGDEDLMVDVDDEDNDE